MSEVKRMIRIETTSPSTGTSTAVFDALSGEKLTNIMQIDIHGSANEDMWQARIVEYGGFAYDAIVDKMPSLIVSVAKSDHICYRCGHEMREETHKLRFVEDKHEG